MSRHFSRMVVSPALALVGLAFASFSAAAPPEKADAEPPQAAKQPAAKGLAYIDQIDNDKRLAGYRTPRGFKVEIVADGPVVGHPAGLAFADDGTPYLLERVGKPGDEREVVETIRYKDGSTRQVTLPRKKKKDLVKILSSSKNNGVFDTAKVVHEGEGLSGILLHDGWLYLAGRGAVRRCKQSKAGGPYDTEEVVARGFGGDGRHQVSGMVIGNDGWLYITAGEGDNVVEGSDGSRATVLRCGAVFRCRPDGAKLHGYAMGFCKARGAVVFDLAGNVFHADSDDGDAGKFKGCRLMHVPEEGDFGWRLAVGARCCRPDPIRAAAFGELPGKLPPMVQTGPGEPAGLFLYNDTRLPEEHRGLLFHTDASRQQIRAYRTLQTGATFKVVEAFAFLTAPTDKLFHPCQMVLGPDGGTYVVDRRGDGKPGRIYRVSWSGTKEQPALPLRGMDSWAKIARLSDEELIKTLAGEEASDRSRAQVELRRRGEKNRKALVKLLNDEDTALVAKIAALGVLQSMFDADVQAGFAKALKDGDSELQRLAAEALGSCAPTGDRKAQNALLLALSIDDLAVRRTVAVAMGRLAGPGAADNLATALSFDESKDVYLRDGIVRALEMLGKGGIDALIALADSGVQKDTDRVVEAFLGLRSRAAFAALPKLLDHRHVGSSQRAELIHSATNYQLDPPVSLDLLVAHVAGRKETADVKKALLEVLAAPGTATGDKAAAWVVAHLTDRSAVVRLKAIAAVQQMRPVKAGPILAKRLAEEKQTEAEVLATVKALAVLPSTEATAALKALLAAEGTTTPILRATVEGLGGTAEGARFVGKRYLDKKLPASVLPDVLAALRKHAAKDAEAGKLLAEVMKSADAGKAP